MGYKAIDYVSVMPSTFSAEKVPSVAIQVLSGRSKVSAVEQQVADFIKKSEMMVWRPEDFSSREIWCASLTQSEREEACKILASDYDELIRKSRGNMLSYVAERMIEKRRFISVRAGGGSIFTIRFYPTGIKGRGIENAGWFDDSGKEYWLGYDLDTVYQQSRNGSVVGSPALAHLYVAYDFDRTVVEGHWSVK